MPRLNAQSARWETSIIRIDGIGEAQIWQIGAEVVEPRQGKPAKAWGEATVAEIRSVTLDVDTTPEPHPRHLDLIGWPLRESPEEQRSIQQSLAAELALKARLHKRQAE